MQKTWVIYKHTLLTECEHKGWSYIGQTCMDVPEARWGKNGEGYSSQLFFRAIEKYGWDSFSHEILEEGIQTLEEANERERFWIDYYHTWINDDLCAGYNVDHGGTGQGLHSQETKNKISKSLLGHTVTDKMREKSRLNALGNKYHLGHKHSEETKEKCRIASTGVKQSDETKTKRTKTINNIYDSEKAHKQIRKDGSRLVRRVQCIETGIIYRSLAEAYKQTGVKHILDCCKGRRNIAGGFHWKYIEDDGK